MPELPDLEVVAGFLDHQLAGATIDEAQVLKPIVVRNLTGQDPVVRLQGQRVHGVSRRGKFLLFELASGDWIVVNPMRSGHLRFWKPYDKARGRPFFSLRFVEGFRLDYSDPDTMGKVYLTPALELVPTFAGLGPDAFSPGVTLEVFIQRLRGHRGEIKGVLTNQAFLAGIGNAYADEILFRASVYPFRKVRSLTSAEVEDIHEAMNSVLGEALRILQQRVGEDIHEEIRDFLRVHGRSGLPCPRCGNAISAIKARGRLTNFCRNCQPGRMT